MLKPHTVIHLHLHTHSVYYVVNNREVLLNFGSPSESKTRYKVIVNFTIHSHRDSETLVRSRLWLVG